MSKDISASLNNRPNLVASLRQAIKHGGALQSITGSESLSDFQNTLSQVAGTEAFGLGEMLGAKVGPHNLQAVTSAMSRKAIPARAMESMREFAEGLGSIEGTEGFSLQNFEGDEATIKAANIALNAQSQMQTKAAEALFPTVSVSYEDEGVNLKVRAAGIGSYVYGATAWQSASSLRPIFGLLRSGEIFKDEVLNLYPVYPASAGDENRVLFAPETLVAPRPASYPEGDAYGRTSHNTQYLAVPSTVPNLLALCQTPGQRSWTSTDEIESNSITIGSLGIAGKLDGDDVSFFVDTKAMSNNTFGPTTNGQSSDDRGLNLHIRNLPGFAVRDKDGVVVGATLFADIQTAGYEPMLTVTLSGNYQRQSNELRLNSGSATVTGLRNIATGDVVVMGKATTAEKALMRSLTEATVKAANVGMNVSNTSRGNFGYRIEVFDATKHLAVRRGSPVSVKYPISKDDVNEESLNFAIEQMSIALNNYRSRKAFDVAQEHLEYITSIDGSPVVANDQGSNVLAGQHYVTASAVNRSVKLSDIISAQNSMEVFQAVTAGIANEISDVISALNTKSGLSAINEYGGEGPTKWVAVAHQNIARFLMRQGEARTLGVDLPVEAIETNFDSQIGQIIIVPASNSSSETINPLAGIGVCVAKENILVQGNVTRDQQDFGVVMSMPSFRHWPLNPVIGSLIIEDAEEFLTDEGLLNKLAIQRISMVTVDPKP